MEKIDQILESLYDRVIEPVEAKEQLLLLFGVMESDLHNVTNRTFSVDEVKILLEKQKQACANEFIHAEMTMEQAKRRVLNAPTVSF